MPKQQTYFKRLNDCEKKISLKIRTEYKREIQNYCQCSDLLDEIIGYLTEATSNEPRELDAVDTAFITMSVRIGQSSKVFMDLTLKGYYYDSMIIDRHLLEKLYFLLFLELNERKVAEQIAEKWVHTGKLETKKIKEFVGVYSFEPFIKLNTQLNDFAHANFPAIVLSTLKKNNQQNFSLISELEFREEFHHNALDPIVSLLTIIFVLHNFKKDIKPEYRLKFAKKLTKINSGRAKQSEEINQAILQFFSEQ